MPDDKGNRAMAWVGLIVTLVVGTWMLVRLNEAGLGWQLLFGILIAAAAIDWALIVASGDGLRDRLMRWIRRGREEKG